jgi:hypothetical protein
MLFESRFVDGIRSGAVTVTFRRWKRPQAAAGRRQRTIAGIIEVEAIDVVEPGAISDMDARRAGYPDAGALVADLRGTPALPLYRIQFRAVRGPDPRDTLAADGDLSPEALAELDRRLARLDAAGGAPWTRATLEVIAARPEVRAADLAASLGRDTPSFKLDVRKLKALGLTISLERGYRLSPRGAAYLTHLEPAAERPGTTSP